MNKAIRVIPLGSQTMAFVYISCRVTTNVPIHRAGITALEDEHVEISVAEPRPKNTAVRSIIKKALKTNTNYVEVQEGPSDDLKTVRVVWSRHEVVEPEKVTSEILRRLASKIKVAPKINPEEPNDALNLNVEASAGSKEGSPRDRSPAVLPNIQRTYVNPNIEATAERKERSYQDRSSAPSPNTRWTYVTKVKATPEKNNGSLQDRSSAPSPTIRWTYTKPKVEATPEKNNGSL